MLLKNIKKERVEFHCKQISEERWDILATIPSWPAIHPVPVLTVCDSSTTQATKLPLKIVFSYSDGRDLLSVLLSADPETTSNLSLISSKQTSF